MNHRICLYILAYLSLAVFLWLATEWINWCLWKILFKVKWNSHMQIAIWYCNHQGMGIHTETSALFQTRISIVLSHIFPRQNYLNGFYQDRLGRGKQLWKEASPPGHPHPSICPFENYKTGVFSTVASNWCNTLSKDTCTLKEPFWCSG